MPAAWFKKKTNQKKNTEVQHKRKKKHNATCERRPYPAGPDSSRPRHAIQNYTVCMIPRETSIDISKILKLVWVNIAIRMLRRKRHVQLHRFFLICRAYKTTARMRNAFSKERIDQSSHKLLPYSRETGYTK